MKCGKTIETAHRALEILKELMTNNLSVDEILYSLTSDEDYSFVYAKETIYKYLNTFKSIGIDINKQKITYSVDKGFYKFPCSNEDKYILNLIENYTKITCQKTKQKKLENIKKTLYKNNFDFNSNIVSLNYYSIFKLSQKYEKYKSVIEKIENACKLQEQLKIKYIDTDKNIIEYKVFANKIFFEKGNLIFQGFCTQTNEMKSFLIENIKEIESLPQKSAGNYYTKTAIFNILNEFSKNYKLKEGEYIKEKKENYLQIVSKYQDSDILLKRLLRYGYNCEIISPMSLRKTMKNKIEQIYQLYN